MKNKIIVIILGLFVMSACEGFLDEKPSKRIIVPTTIDDLYSIVANVPVMNFGIALGVILSDDMFTNDDGYRSFSIDFWRDAYKWNRELFDVDGSNGFWFTPYRTIFHTNLIIETAKEIQPFNQRQEEDLQNLRGMALFYRANAHASLLQFFSRPVLNSNDLLLPGIPIKLNTDVNDHPPVSSIGNVYDQIFEDLTEALSLLPDSQPSVLRPSKIAVYSLLARLYLILGDYQKAFENSSKVLESNFSLMKFEEIASGKQFPLPMFQNPIPVLNKEIIYFEYGGSTQFLTSPLSFIATDLIEKYDENDWRKLLYFTPAPNSGNFNFNGHYTGDFQHFSGIALDEIFLINAESLARLNRGSEGLEILNQLLITRYKTGTFQPILFESNEQAINVILEERRKSLVFRGYSRWTDLRRFLKDPNWEGPQKRLVIDQSYELGLEPKNYYLVIPPNEIELNPAF